MGALTGSNIFGNKGNNILHGTDGNDLFAGLGGNDTLIGYDGTDTAWYSGVIKDYLISTGWNGNLTLTDRNTTDGDDGYDTLSGIENLAFGNGSLTVSGEFQVNTTTIGYQISPTIAGLADGGYVVTWTSFGQDGNGTGIYGQRYDAGGNAAGSEFRVNTYTTGDQYAPATAALANGGFVVTWQSAGQDGSGSGIYGQRYDAGGNAAGSEFQVNTYTLNSQFTPAVTALTNGSYLVTWQSTGQDGSGYGIYGQRYDAGGNAAGSEFRVNTYTTGDQYAPATAALANGGFVVTWQSTGQDGSGSGIYGQRYDAGGNAAGSEFRVNTTTASYQDTPAVTALANGGYLVTWQSYLQDGSSFGIYGQRYDAGGNAAGGEFRVNTYLNGDQYQPAVTALTNGGYVVTWQSYGQDGSGSGIYGQRYDAAGNAAGSEFRVNTTTTDSQYEPAVAALTDGGYVVTWYSYGQDGSGAGIYTQRYDFAGNPVGLTVTGTAGADVLNLGYQTLLTVDGAGGNDTINGGNGNDNLLGGAGNDTLTGGAGDDRLDGGTGNDVMNGGNGSDTYVVDSATDTITDTGTTGSDTVLASVSYTLGAALENLTLIGSANLNATGNASGNFLQGNDGNNVLDGRAGGDLMAGGAGDEIYMVDSPFDLVAENANQGTDTVQSLVSYVLGDNVENLILTGAATNNGTGNGLANILEGNAAANTLLGFDGNDTLRGQGGNDTLNGGNGDDYLVGGAGIDLLIGGTGSDTFRFDQAPVATNVDHVSDFVSGTDHVFLATNVFNQLGGPGALNPADFAASTSFANSDVHHLLYNTSTGGLYYNADGAGAGAPVLVAVLDNHPTIASTDFVLG